MAELMGKGVLGDKTGGGFFGKDDGGNRIVLDPKTRSTSRRLRSRVPDLTSSTTISNLHRVGRYEEGMQAFLRRPTGTTRPSRAR